MKKEALDLVEEEWDFSELSKGPIKGCDETHFAHWWELHREAAKLAGYTPIPPPWLSIDPSCRPFFCGGFLGAPKLTPLREIGEMSAPDGVGLENRHTFGINLAYSKADILAAFEQWLRKTYPPRGDQGRRDTNVARLWDLSIYRLRVKAGLGIRECQQLLRHTAAKDRRWKLFGEFAARAFNDAVSKVRRSLEGENENSPTGTPGLIAVYRKNDLAYRFLMGHWAASQYEQEQSSRGR